MIRVLMDFYEKNLKGVYAGDPHSYEFNLGAGHESLSKIHDIVCQAVEIDGLAVGDYLLTIICQEGDTVLGNSDFIVHLTNVERTTLLSKYVKQSGNPPVFAINRDTLKYTLEFVPASADGGEEKHTSMF